MVRMDEKTEELREVFLDVADEETVTERQSEQRGSIVVDEAEMRKRLRSTVDRMAERYGYETVLSRNDLVEIVQLFYAGRDDADIAEELEADVSTADVARARIDLHLVTEEDREGNKTERDRERDDYQDSLEAGQSVEEIAAERDVDEIIVERHRRVREVQEERREVDDRFRREFERTLGEQGLSARLTEGVAEDGLEDATEGIETNVSF